jgi:hypothetical protein
MRVGVSYFSGKDAPWVFVSEDVQSNSCWDAFVRERATASELHDHGSAHLVIPPRLDGFAFHVVQGNRAAHASKGAGTTARPHAKP